MMANKLILNSIEEAAKSLLLQAKELRKNPEDDSLASARPLRVLQMQSSQMVQLPYSTSDRFLLFFISLFIEDIFSNILTDAPYTIEIKKARENLFNEIGDLLKQLARAYRNNKEAELYKIYKELVQVYLDKIDILNLQTKEML